MESFSLMFSSIFYQPSCRYHTKYGLNPRFAAFAETNIWGERILNSPVPYMKKESSCFREFWKITWILHKSSMAIIENNHKRQNFCHLKPSRLKKKCIFHTFEKIKCSEELVLIQIHSFASFKGHPLNDTDNFVNYSIKARQGQFYFQYFHSNLHTQNRVTQSLFFHCVSEESDNQITCRNILLHMLNHLHS